MNSPTAIVKSAFVNGTMEWEIKNISCVTTKPKATVESGVIVLTTGKDTQSQWHLSCYVDQPNRQYQFLIVNMQFHWFSGNAAVASKEFNYEIRIQGGKSATEMVYLGAKSGTGEFEMGRQYQCENINMDLVRQSIGSDGIIKVSVHIIHASNSNEDTLDKGYIFEMDEEEKDSLASCYGNLFNNPFMSDFTIICEDSTLFAHKLVLSARTRVFRAMLESGMSESSRNEMKIDDATLKVVKLMLEYIYKGTIEKFPTELNDQLGLLDCGEKYELDGLKTICMKKLFSNPLTEKEVGELAMAAYTYRANKQATSAIKEYCMRNYGKLIQNPEYKRMFLAHPHAFMN